MRPPNCTLQLMVLGAVLSLTLAEDFYQLLGVSRQASQREIRKAFKKLALTMHPDKNQEDADANDKFIKINRAYEVLKDEELRKKYDMHGEDGLKEDGPSGRGYQSWNFYNQDFGIYDDDPEIITLSKSDFEQSVENSEDVWFVNYYSPQCSHCHTLAPTWREVARELEGVIRIGAVNCGDDWMLCRQQGIRSYPSLVLYPERERYSEDKSTKQLVRFALRHIRAQVVELWSGNFESEMKDEERENLPWLITYCGDGGDCLERSTCTKLAAMLSDLASVGVVDCHAQGQALCSQLGVDHGTYFYEAGEVKKGGALELSTLDAREIAFAVLRQLPEVTVLKKDTFEKHLQNLKVHADIPWLIHFVEGDVDDLELRKLPALLATLNVGRVDCRLLRTICNDLHVHKFPSFTLFKRGGGHEIHHGRQTAHDIANFARDSAATPVQVLGPDNFPMVTQSPEPWFIDYFAPWCPPCMRLLPEFRKASKSMSDKVNFGTVDCTVHSVLCQNQQIQSYPTTILYNQSVPHHFNGHHSSNDIIEFLEDTLKPPVIILTPDNYDRLVTNKSPETIWLIDFFAPWCGPCQQLAPEWRKLAKMFDKLETVKVGQVDCQAHRSVCQQAQVNSYPAIHLYPTGSSSTFHNYNNWFRDAPSIRAWAFEFLPSKVTVLNWESFQSSVLKGSDPWVVDFYAPWCGHCQVFAPEFERAAQALEGKVRAGKVDCDANNWMCQQAGVRAYPTVRFYKGSHKAGFQQSIYGEELNSQDANYLISFLGSKVKDNKISAPKVQENVHDEF